MIVVLPLVLSSVAAPSAARAASIAVDRACYADPSERRDTVRLTGTGFTPNAQYQVTLDGQPFAGGTGTTDGSGNLTGSFIAPDLPSGSNQHTFRVGVQEGANAPETAFTVSNLVADFTPASGDPKTLRVRFKFFGFGLSDAAPPPTPVYVHYVRPGDGKVQKTVRLGTARGACGAITRTARRRLFPFTPKAGTWKLQFDAQQKYVRGTAKTTFLFFTIPVKVRAA